ncbi:DUF927 domain-containing protein [Streptomyces parvulus]|uniref:DUF927 domain-containing protein n=1 Tax=Streptomyces parvulus TaxID=146923 RepID=A0A191UWP6_9ACTN|nr:DUF927 domain-containing protein [Streptomyces parvulus]ANJ07154.1 hypothetical protein Spa2297_09140 [Streptomyces parvulus]GGR74362.1 hypothetical protein GCM10010220_28330 [Streptomyces parvulus]
MSDETTEQATEEWADHRLVPEGVRMPAGYSISYSGVWVEKQFGKEIVNVRVAWAPLVIKAVYVDPAGDQAVELAWVDRGQVVTRTVQRSIVRRGRILVATLGDAGLPVIEADAKLAERYLAAFESINQGKIPRVHLARQLGWQKDGTFVTAQDTPHRVEVKFDEQKPALAAHAPAGTFAGWQASVKPMEAYPAAQMALYASLAAPLLELVGVNSFTVDISGRSTRGKTTAAGAGMSVWADPSEKADGMYSWRTTMLAAEKRLNLVNGLPVVFDETKLVRDPEMVHALLYSIPKNHGQARGGGWPSGLPWRTVMISTGEQSVLTFTTDQGAGARVLTVKEAPFGTDGPESATAAIDVRDGCAEHYGTAGPRFVEKLLEETAGDGKRRLVARHKELTEAHRYDSDMSARRAPLVAVLALAAEAGHEWGIVPFPAPPMSVWERLFAVGDQTDNRGEMALDVVREYVASNRRSLWAPGTSNDPPFSGWIGRELEVDNEPTVGLLAQKLKEALSRAGYELESVIPSWREAAVLVENASYRPPYLAKKKMNGGQVRLYIFKPEVFAAPDDEDGE